jgi:hypothetical protein
MRTIAIILLVLCLLLTGCEPEQQQSQNQQVYPKIEQAEEQPVKQQQQASLERTEPNTPAVQSEQPQAKAGQQTPDIKVDVTILTVDEKDFEALDALWGNTTSALTMKKRSDLFEQSELKVNMTAGDFGSKFNAFKNSIKYKQEKEISLELADREAVYLNLGTGIKNTRFYYLTKWYDAKDYRFDDAGRGFNIKVIKVPGRELLNVQITPVLKNFLKDGSDEEFEELRTALTIEPVQSILIGGTRTSREYLSSVLLGLQKKDVDTVILLNFSEM